MFTCSYSAYFKTVLHKITHRIEHYFSMSLMYSKSISFDELLNNAVEKYGSFCVSSRTSLPNPLLKHRYMDDVIGFPIPSVQAKELYDKASPAPFGKGKETLIDAKVRNCRRVLPSDISFLNPDFLDNIKKIELDLAIKLGISEKVRVTSKFHNLLVYPEGGFFLEHRDAVKEDGMFGTMIVSLPSRHSGGTLRVSHNGDTRMWHTDTDYMSYCEYPTELNVVAFYNDCLHECEVVSKGHRIVLVFNLIMEPKKATKDSVKKLTEEGISSLNECKKYLRGNIDRVRRLSHEKLKDLKFIHSLYHAYPLCDVKEYRLKGKDFARLQLVEMLQLDFVVLCANGMIYEVPEGCREDSGDVNVEVTFNYVQCSQDLRARGYDRILKKHWRDANAQSVVLKILKTSFSEDDRDYEDLIGMADFKSRGGYFGNEEEDHEYEMKDKIILIGGRYAHEIIDFVENYMIQVDDIDDEVEVDGDADVGAEFEVDVGTDVDPGDGEEKEREEKDGEEKERKEKERKEKERDDVTESDVISGTETTSEAESNFLSEGVYQELFYPDEENPAKKKRLE